MVKLRVAARVIPEDIYIQSLTATNPLRGPLAGEKKFPIIVREPEEWHIGRLANEIKAAYERLYKRPLGQIKYLKDNEDDCDLDPEFYVADLLVDEGKAAQDGADQHVTVKVIQEQGRAVRQGSVIPDLDRAHYQVPSRPPVPKFAEVPTSLGKRKHDEPQPRLNGAGPKRPRMGQIREQDEDDVVSSIERDGVPESSAVVIENSQSSGPRRDQQQRYADIKHESPELPGYSWSNVEPATRDELEVLPEAPARFRSSRGGGLATTTARRSDSREQSRGRSSAIKDMFDRAQRSKSRASSSLARTESTMRTPGAAVSALNRMKSHSPAQTPVARSGLQRSTKSGSGSVGKFLGSRRNMYDYPESEIDDTQMSPRSRASQNGKITPRLVSSTRKETSSAVQNEETPSDKHDARHDGEMDVDSLDEQARQDQTDDDQKGSKKARGPRKSTSDSGSSVTSASTENQHSERSVRKSLLAAIASREQTEEGLDSPSMQLENEAGMSARELVQVRQRREDAVRASLRDVGLEQETDQPNQEEEEDQEDEHDDDDEVNRLPDSVSEEEGSLQKGHKRKRVSRLSNPKGSARTDRLSDDLRRCYSCWVNTTTCDNAKPKCGACERKKKNCLVYDVTKEEAMQIKVDRKTAKTAGQKSKRAAKQKPLSKSKVDKKQVLSRSESAEGEIAEHEDTEAVQDKPVKRRRGPASKVGARNTAQNKTSTSASVPTLAQKSTSPELASKTSDAAESSSEREEESKPQAAPPIPSHSQLAMMPAAVSVKAMSNPAPGQLGSGSESDESETQSPDPQQERQQPQLALRATSPQESMLPSHPSALSTISSTAKTGSISPQDRRVAHEPSSDIRATPVSQSKILPPGMTEEEYNRKVAANASMTDEQRQEHKRLAKQNVASLRKTASHESAHTANKQPQSQSITSSSQAGSVAGQKGEAPVTSSTKTPSIASKTVGKTASVAGSTHSHPTVNAATVAGKQIPSLTKQTTQDSVCPTPNIATAIATPPNNPAFKPQQPKPQRRVAPTTTPSTTNPRHQSVPKPPPSDPFAEAVKPLASVKSVAELRQILSARSTPTAQPRPTTSTTAASATAGGHKQVGTTRPGLNKGFSLSDDDDDDEDSETDTEEEREVFSSARQTQPGRANVVKAVVNAAAETTSPSSDSGSEESDTDEEEDDE